MSENPAVVTIQNQFGSRFPVTHEFYIRHKDNLTNPLTLVEEDSTQAPIEDSVTELQFNAKEKAGTRITESLEKPPEETRQEIKVPRKPGRPKGSKNKPKSGFRKKRKGQANIKRKIVPKQKVSERKLEGFATK